MCLIQINLVGKCTVLAIVICIVKRKFHLPALVNTAWTNVRVCLQNHCSVSLSFLSLQLVFDNCLGNVLTSFA